MNKTLVLLSGGLDSTVLLYDAVRRNNAENVTALSVYYGQKHDKERTYAEWTCEHLKVNLLFADLSSVFKFNPSCCALLQGSTLDIKHESYGEQLKELGGGGTVTAYVPYRNGLFLSYAAAVALQLDCTRILYGAHKDDAAGRAYPDCSEEFIEAQADAISYGTNGKVQLLAPFAPYNKAQIVSHALTIGMKHEELAHTWSCYEGKEEPCGTCGTCLDRIHAFEENGIFDIK